MTPMSAYVVDILHAKSAQATAATACLRSLCTGLAILAFLPLIDRIGVLATNPIFADVIWSSLAYVIRFLFFQTYPEASLSGYCC